MITRWRRDHQSASPEAGRAYYPGVGGIAAAQATPRGRRSTSTTSPLPVKPPRLGRVRGRKARRVRRTCARVSRAGAGVDDTGMRSNESLPRAGRMGAIRGSDWRRASRASGGSGDVSMSMTLTPGTYPRRTSPWRAVSANARPPEAVPRSVLKAPATGTTHERGWHLRSAVCSAPALCTSRCASRLILKDAQVDGRDLLDQSITSRR